MDILPETTEPCKLAGRTGIAALFILLLASLPIDAAADGISGSLEYNYGTFNTKNTDVTGTSKSKSTNFNQRYSLRLENALTTTLKLSAGTTIQQGKSWGETDGEDSTSTTTRIAPYASLAYANNMISAGGGFNRNKVSSKQNELSNPAKYTDTYNAYFNWKPEDLPTLSLLFTNLDAYDESRTAADLNSKSLFLSSRYKPLKNLELNYANMFTTTTNQLQGYEATSFSQSMMARYSDAFFANRVVLGTGYSISLQDSTLKNSGTSGEVPEQVAALGGFFAIAAHTPGAETEQGALEQNRSIIDGDANILLTSANPPVNVGLNFGMRFDGLLNPDVQISKIRVLVSSTDLSSDDDWSRKVNLLETRFTWNVYISDNNLDWTRVPFTSQAFTLTDPVILRTARGFDINFAPLSGNRLQYVKVVVSPARLDDTPPLPLLTNVAVVKLEAYNLRALPQTGTSRSSSQTGGVFDLYLRARLLNVPLITYDLGYNLSHSQSDTSAFSYRYNVINGLSLSHQFNQVFSTAARLSREDSVSPGTSSASNSFGVSLSATPLPTLSHTLSFSARQDLSPGLEKTSYSLSNSNSAELYRGVNVSLSLSGSMGSDNSGKEQQSTTGSFGVNLAPHKTMGINMSVSAGTSSVSGGGRPDASSTTRSGDLSINYTPLPALYMYASSSVSNQTGLGTRTAISFGGGWSPFRDGTLKFNTAYNESLQEESKIRTFSQTISWKIRQGTSFDTAYLYSVSSGIGTSNTSDGVTGTLKIRF